MQAGLQRLSIDAPTNVEPAAAPVSPPRWGQWQTTGCSRLYRSRNAVRKTRNRQRVVPTLPAPNQSLLAPAF